MATDGDMSFGKEDEERVRRELATERRAQAEYRMQRVMEHYYPFGKHWITCSKCGQSGPTWQPVKYWYPILCSRCHPRQPFQESRGYWAYLNAMTGRG